MEQDILKNLNQEQKKAVLHDRGPLLIIAGAGTGKTTVITHRIAYLIKTKKAKPEEILALTFTDKAAAEMEERVDILVPYGFVDTWISTFHAFGDRILREHALEVGLPTDFKVLSRPEQILFLRDHLSELNLNHYCPLSNPLHYLEALATLFSRIKDEDISAEEFLKYGQKKVKTARSLEEKEEADKKLELAKVFNKYQELMLKEGNIDFGDQIILTLKLFRENKKILETYQKQFKYILVDEFQDTNFAQNELVKILAGKNGNITVVADDDQSIYRFRGAAVSNVLEFKKNFPKAKQIVLFKNYRSTQQILDNAYQLIQHNNPDRLEIKNKINKKLESQKQGPEPYFLQCHDLISEADKVAAIILEKIKSKKYSFKDFAILIRKNNQAKSFMMALNRYQIPYQFTGASGLYDREEIRLIISFMRALLDYDDSISFYNLVTSSIYKMPIREAVKLNTYANKIKRPLSYLFENYKSLDDDFYTQLSPQTIKIIEKVNKDFDKFYQETLESTAGQLIYKFLKDTGYLKNLVEKANNDPMAGAKIQNIAKFFEKIREFEHVSSDKSLLNFKNHLDILIEAGEDPATAEIDPDLDAVNILTIHKAKGLEFKIVFLVNLYQGSFPVRKQAEILPLPDDLIKETLPSGDYHLQEERRLFYVGVTRAREELYLTTAFDYGGKKRAKVSQFVLEFFDKPELKAPVIKTEKLELIKRTASYEEKYFLKNFYNGQGILKLNPHQIDDYLSCPLKFKYIHILKIPILKHHPVIYGSAIHKAIEEYYVRRLNNYPIKLSDILNTFENNWESVGFITREHEEKRFLAGQQALKEFFKRENKNKNLPTYIEKKFNCFLAFPKYKLTIKISGRYDALYLKNKPHYVEIRDFKTGEVKEQKKADLRVRQNRQMSIYALSWLINHHYLPDKISLYFVDTGLIGECHKEEKDLKKTEEEILLVAEGILNNDFEPQPKWQECNRCAYSDICSYTQSEV